MLADKDRIFTNLYGFQDPGLEGAKKRGQWDNTKALLALGRAGRAVVKLSGFAKFSREGFPFVDARPVIDAMAQAFGLQQCVWASDWPFLKAPYRLDYGPLLKIYEGMFSADERHQLMWLSAQTHLGF